MNFGQQPFKFDLEVRGATGSHQHRVSALHSYLLWPLNTRNIAFTQPVHQIGFAQVFVLCLFHGFNKPHTHCQTRNVILALRQEPSPYHHTGTQVDLLHC